jgi:glutathione S-transferase
MMGETRDLRVQWALENAGLPYHFHGLDHTGREMHSGAYSRISRFRHVPVIDDDGFIVAESDATVLYIADKAGTLIPSDFQGRIVWFKGVFQGPPLLSASLEILLIDKFGYGGDGAKERRSQMVKEAGRWLDGSERRLSNPSGSPARSSRLLISCLPVS